MDLKKGLSFLWPDFVTCAICDVELDAREEKHLCETCEKGVERIEGHLCATCGRPVEGSLEALSPYGYKCKSCQEQFSYIARHRSFAHYEGSVKKMLMAIKYAGKRYHLAYIHGALNEVLAKEFAFDAIDYVMPVPVHFTRLLSRGFNQSALIAKGLGDSRQYLDGFKRIKKTKRLKNLSRDERQMVLKDAIILKSVFRSSVLGKNILIVDDIYTTGATLNACAKTLYEAGAKNVYAMTFAMGY